MAKQKLVCGDAGNRESQSQIEMIQSIEFPASENLIIHFYVGIICD